MIEIFSMFEATKLIRKSINKGSDQTINDILEYIAKNRLLSESQFSVARKTLIKAMLDMGIKE